MSFFDDPMSPRSARSLMWGTRTLGTAGTAPTPTIGGGSRAPVNQRRGVIPGSGKSEAANSLLNPPGSALQSAASRMAAFRARRRGAGRNAETGLTMGTGAPGAVLAPRSLIGY